MRHVSALRAVPNKALPLTNTGKIKTVAKLGVKEEYPEEMGIPIPPDTRKRKYNFGFESMKVGGSKFIALIDGLDIKTQDQNIRRYINEAKRKSNGEMEFTARTLKDDTGGVIGFRVWRIKA